MIAVYLLTINALGFWLMRTDKLRARRKQWRIPEAVLLAIAAAGGGAGSWLGMYLFHHKTKKPRFYISVPLFAVIQTALIWRFL